MTDPKPMTAKEAARRLGLAIKDVHVLRAQVGWKDYDNAYQQDNKALATLETLAEEQDGGKIVMKAMMLEIDNLKAEVERFKNFALVANDNENIWKDRAEKAEAELDAARPLLAVATRGWGEASYRGTWRSDLETAALAYREGKEKP